MSEPVSIPSLGIDFTRRRNRASTDVPCMEMFSELRQDGSNTADEADTSRDHQNEKFASQRSTTSMRGLLAAENGDAMVALDISGSGFTTGERILSDDCTGPRLPAPSSEEPFLTRHGTLLTVGASSVRNAAELKSILGNSNARLKAGAIVPPSSIRTIQVDKTSLEQAKPRARVEVDIILDSKTCVEGGHLRGQVKIRIRKRAMKESAVLISGGKIRVIGFECINGRDDRHTFYQVSTLLSDVSDDHTVMYDSPPDTEGFYLAKEGVYVFPFAMELPLDGGFGVPKGVLHSHSALTVRYIAMFSIKVKERETGKRSIAHFYRDCEIWPRLNPSVVLAPSPTPIRNATSKRLFMGGDGKVTLSASIHRLHWVAGQYCCVRAHVTNYSKKTIKSLTLSLSRSTVFFKPRPYLEVDCQQEDNDPDACQTSTTDRQVAESTLQMGQRGARGHASAKGWWTGVQPGETQEFSHFLLLPPDALTMPRGRLLEVEYEIRVSVSAGPLGSDVSVFLPIKIINFLSIDPPPSSPFPLSDSVPSQRDTTRDSEAYMIGAMLQSLEESDEELQDEHSDEEQQDEHSDGLPSEGSGGDIGLDASKAYDGVCDSEQDIEQREHRQLGNLAMSDDTDEVVQHAITSARIDARYGEQGNRFADLFYASYPQGLNNAGHEVREEKDVGNTPRAPLGEGVDSSRIRSKGPSSFTQRVEEKMRAAGEENRLTRLNTDSSVPRTTSGSESRCPSPVIQDSYFRPREQIPDSLERTNPMEKTASASSAASSSASCCTCGFSRGSSRSSRTSDGSLEAKSASEAASQPAQLLSSSLPSRKPSPSPSPESSEAAPAPIVSTTRPRGKTVSEATAELERQFAAGLASSSSPAKKPITAPQPLAFVPSLTTKRSSTTSSAPSTAPPSPLKNRESATIVPTQTKPLTPLSVKDKIRQLEEKAQSS